MQNIKTTIQNVAKGRFIVINYKVKIKTKKTIKANLKTIYTVKNKNIRTKLDNIKLEVMLHASYGVNDRPTIFNSLLFIFHMIVDTKQLNNNQ